ncbi:hypothetical protein [Ralstonia insidiosa]|uniref:Lipoprotein n=1 Tax=Ralstonia insidiosa TaxID=190721 RepID=A0A848P359_9RALS|nr:hypothetical protein [Ralstonia insidiosa]NMV39074.1 hypothetical protein [Ralstonia insidiosa]
MKIIFMESRLGRLVWGFFFAIIVSGCAAPRYAYTKDGASAFQTANDKSECAYQVKLNKTAQNQQAELVDLCMKGKGYRLKRVG